MNAHEIVKIRLLKEKFVPNTKVRYLGGSYLSSSVPEGTDGFVRFVDDEGHISVNWSNGRTRSLIPGDKYELVTN